MAVSQLQLQLAAMRAERAREATTSRGHVRIGTCGFSYPEWIGAFYPRGTRMGDMLRHYAGEFNCVEINSSYYGVPTPETTLRFVRNTPEGFVFIVKANRQMTHEVDPSRRVFDDFKHALAPLERAGKLACVLAQFPQRFHRDNENIDSLIEFRELMRDLCVVIEFRHASWSAPETFALLDQLNLHYCCVDEPALPALMPKLQTVTGIGCPCGPLAYVRFHGRNARQWHQHEHAWQRYDYLYSDQELKPWAEWLGGDGIGEATQSFGLFNNHAQAQAVQDARRMRRLLARPRSGPE